MYKKFLRTVYQDRLVFYYFKNNIKRYPKNGKNAYLAIKAPRAPRALRWALDPNQLGLTLCNSAVLHWQNWIKNFGAP